MLSNNILELMAEKKPFYIENAVTPFYTFKDLENTLNNRPLMNINNLTIISNSTYKWDIPYWCKSNSFPVNVLAEEIQKHVCYLKDASRINKETNTVAEQLEVLTNRPVDAHIYFSFVLDKKEGFGIHNDVTDNLIVQMEGVTNVKVWGTPCKDYTQNIDKLDEEPLLNVDMKPGDAIYVPKKYWHAFYSKSHRLSISFTIANEYAEAKFECRQWLNINKIK